MNSLNYLEQRILTPLNGVAATSDGSAWEQIWRGHHPYTNLLRRLSRTLDKIRILRELGVEFRGRKVLDIGCGDGTTLALLHDWHRIKGCGIDISPSAVKIARHRSARQDIFFRVADGRNIPFANLQFDIVLSWGVLEHGSDFQLAIAEAHRVLRETGELVLIQPHLLSFALLQEGWLRIARRWPYGKQINFPFWTLRRLLYQHGFHSVEVHVRPAPKDFGVASYFDRILNAFWPRWGHYLYLIATR
jgi:SAM-dependent methyltransferase